MDKKKHIKIPVFDVVQTGNKIKNLRKLKNFSVHEVQDLFGFEYPQAIYAWERGLSAPKIDHLIVLAKLFDVSLDDLVCYYVSEVECSCSDHVANCMNKDSETCEKCKFKKSA